MPEKVISWKDLGGEKPKEETFTKSFEIITSNPTTSPIETRLVPRVQCDNDTTGARLLRSVFDV